MALYNLIGVWSANEKLWIFEQLCDALYIGRIVDVRNNQSIQAAILVVFNVEIDIPTFLSEQQRNGGLCYAPISCIPSSALCRNPGDVGSTLGEDSVQFGGRKQSDSHWNIVLKRRKFSSQQYSSFWLE